VQHQDALQDDDVSRLHLAAKRRKVNSNSVRKGHRE